MRLERATLISFDAATYTATVQPAESLGTYLLGVPVSGHLSAGLMVAGLSVGILAFDELISSDRLIVGIWGAIPVEWVTSAMIVDGTIVNADISASAAIAASKIAAGTFPTGTYAFADFGSLSVLATASGRNTTGLQTTFTIAADFTGLVLLSGQYAASYTSYHVYAVIGFGAASTVPQVVHLGGADGGFDATRLALRLAATGAAYTLGVYCDTWSGGSTYSYRVAGLANFSS